jgi:hypothetical protein
MKLNPLVVVAVGGLTTAVNLACADPAITTQPQDQTNYIGDTATLTIVATGTGSLAYQWQKFSTGFVDLASGTNATLTLPNVQTNDAGDYRCVVTDTSGTTNSATAHLYVNPPDTIFISNSAPGMVTLSWKGIMVLLEAFNPNLSSTNAPDLNCTIWFYVSNTSPVTLPIHPDPRFFRLISQQTIASLQAAAGSNLNLCLQSQDVGACDDFVRAHFLSSPLLAGQNVVEVGSMGSMLGSCICPYVAVISLQIENSGLDFP